MPNENPLAVLLSRTVEIITLQRNVAIGWHLVAEQKQPPIEFHPQAAKKVARELLLDAYSAASALGYRPSPGAIDEGTMNGPAASLCHLLRDCAIMARWDKVLHHLTGEELERQILAAPEGAESVSVDHGKIRDIIKANLPAMVINMESAAARTIVSLNELMPMLPPEERPNLDGMDAAAIMPAASPTSPTV